MQCSKYYMLVDTAYCQKGRTQQLLSLDGSVTDRIILFQMHYPIWFYRCGQYIDSCVWSKLASASNFRKCVREP